MLQLSSESSLSSTHTPHRRSLSITILPQSLFFMPVFFWQRCITAEVALNLGEVTLSCSSLLRVVELVLQAGVAVTLSNAYTVNHKYMQMAPPNPHPLPIPKPSNVRKPSLFHQYHLPPPSSPLPPQLSSSLRQSEIAVHTQPSTTSQSY